MMAVENLNVSLEDLSPEERWRVQHAMLHEQHKGHEAMHSEMVLVFFVTVVIAQIILMEWRKRHHKSYLLATLISMWVIPFGISVKNQWWRFIIIWLIFSLITCALVHKATAKPIDRRTPRLVYKWFLLIYKMSCGLGFLGYFILMFTLLGFNVLFNTKPNAWMDAGLICVYYSMYYGVLGRDLSEICADKMAAHVGYYTEDGMPTRHLEQGVCAVCGNKLLVSENEEGVIENSYKLTCGHVFHEFCIRGWCIIGKKQICPYCKEKVDLKKMFGDPWDRPHILYGQLLDGIRYVAGWLPVIMFLIQGIIWLLGLK